MLTLTVHNDEPIRDAVESGLNAFFETKSVLVDATDPLPDDYQESDLVIWTLMCRIPSPRYSKSRPERPTVTCSYFFQRSTTSSW